MQQPQTGKSGEISSVNQHEILILYFSFFHPKNAVERLQPCPLNKRKKLDLGLDRKKVTALWHSATQFQINIR